MKGDKISPQTRLIGLVSIRNSRYAGDKERKYR